MMKAEISASIVALLFAFLFSFQRVHLLVGNTP